MKLGLGGEGGDKSIVRDFFLLFGGGTSLSILCHLSRKLTRSVWPVRGMQLHLCVGGGGKRESREKCRTGIVKKKKKGVKKKRLPSSLALWRSSTRWFFVIKRSRALSIREVVSQTSWPSCSGSVRSSGYMWDDSKQGVTRVRSKPTLDVLDCLKFTHLPFLVVQHDFPFILPSCPLPWPFIYYPIASFLLPSEYLHHDTFF